jgi:predicted DNA-binding protein YlxM (UPF0122 family)
LFEYDQKLHLAERHEQRMAVLSRMNELVKELAGSKTRDELQTLLHQLSEMD